jgi:hypothetical protein
MKVLLGAFEICVPRGAGDAPAELKSTTVKQANPLINALSHGKFRRN